MSNLAAPPSATFGRGNAIIEVPGTDPTLTADLTTARSYFGTIDVIEAQNAVLRSRFR